MRHVAFFSNFDLFLRAHPVSLKGNPVKYRSCTRSCNLLETHCVYATGSSGKATMRQEARRPAKFYTPVSAGPSAEAI